MDLRDWTALIGAVTGVAGLVLGILSTVDRYRRDRVRIRVRPKIGWVNKKGAALSADRDAPPELDPTKGAPPNRLVVEVLNLSAFPVIISEVGFGRADGAARLAVPRPELPSGGSLPQKLEPRQAMQAFCNLPLSAEQRRMLTTARAYAETDCGVVAYGTSPAFKRFVKDVRNGKPPT